MTWNRRVCLALALAVAGIPYLVMAAWLGRHTGAPASAAYAVAVAVTLLILALVGRTTRWLYWLHLPVYAINLAVLAYALVSGELPGYPIAFVLMTASKEEVVGFFSNGQQLAAALAVLLPVAVVAGLAFAIPNRPTFPLTNRRLRWAAIAAVALLGAVAASDPERMLQGAAASPGLAMPLFVSGPLAAANIAVNGPMLRKRPYGAARSATNEIHILIIGESSRRASWSAFGYARPTTPYLDAHRGEIVLLTDAVADGNATVYSVPMLLSGIDPQVFTFQSMHGNLVDLAREAGYRTTWLANQDGGISNMIGIVADRSIFTRRVSRPSYVVYPPDGVLLPDLRRELASGAGPLFIGLHTFGSHSPYGNRFPVAFAHFSGTADTAGTPRPADDRTVDVYDDGILYTDWFIGEILDEARRLAVPATVTYVADHGEDLMALDHRSAHGLTDYSAGAFEIPAFVWLNAAYRSAHGEKVEALRANSGRTIRSHDFFYTLADLMGIRWPGAEPRRSFASPRFAPDVQGKFIAGGQLVSRTTPAIHEGSPAR